MKLSDIIADPSKSLSVTAQEWAAAAIEDPRAARVAMQPLVDTLHEGLRRTRDPRTTQAKIRRQKLQQNLEQVNLRLSTLKDLQRQQREKPISLLLEAIERHRATSEAEDVEPEEHDLALWAALDEWRTIYV